MHKVFFLTYHKMLFCYCWVEFELGKIDVFFKIQKSDSAKAYFRPGKFNLPGNFRTVIRR